MAKLGDWHCRVGREVGDDIPLASLFLESLPDFLRGRYDEGVGAGGSKKAWLGCDGEERYARRRHVVGRPWAGEDPELLGAFGALAQGLEGEFLLARQLPVRFSGAANYVATSARMAGTSAPTWAAGAAAVWLEAKLMLARSFSGLSSREVWLRAKGGAGSCELVRVSTGDERADSERAGDCRGGLGRTSSTLVRNEVGEGESTAKDSWARDGVRRAGVGVEPVAGDCARCASASLSSRALFCLSICASVAGPGTTNLVGGARAEA